MDVTLIIVPYDTALRGVRMGAGPERLLAAGLPHRLAALGHDVQVETVAHATEPPAEIRTAFELMRGVSEGVGRAVRSGRFPVVLSGNCNTAVGTLAGLGGGTGVVWFDAHGDFNTPDTTPTGFLDGTALATATGRCWHALAAAVPGFRPVPEADVVLVGARDFDPPERAALAASGVTVVPPDAFRQRAPFEAALDRMDGRGVYLHLDLDVLDPSHARANGFAVPDGLTPDEVLAGIPGISSRLPVRALALTAYDPTADPSGAVCGVALRVVEAVVAGQLAI